jgi:hypothetical protein
MVSLASVLCEKSYIAVTGKCKKLLLKLPDLAVYSAIRISAINLLLHNFQ